MTNDRLVLYSHLDALATMVAAEYPGVAVGLSVAIVNDDWAIYVGGPAYFLGHGLKDALALQTLWREGRRPGPGNGTPWEFAQGELLPPLTQPPRARASEDT